MGKYVRGLYYKEIGGFRIILKYGHGFGRDSGAFLFAKIYIAHTAYWTSVGR